MSKASVNPIPANVLKLLIDAASKTDWERVNKSYSHKNMDILFEYDSQILEHFSSTGAGKSLQSVKNLITKEIVSSLYLEHVIQDSFRGLKILDPSKAYTIKEIIEAKRSRGLKGLSEKQVKANLKKLKINPVSTAGRGMRSKGGQSKFYSGSDVRFYVIAEADKSSLARQDRSNLYNLLNNRPDIQTNENLLQAYEGLKANQQVGWIKDTKELSDKAFDLLIMKK